jgi:hypothetical protein
LTARALIGPLVIGAAIWCAAGLITVADPDSVATRLAVPAVWWILPLAPACAALVPAWRRRPLTALPAVLSTLPWWPVSWPPVALIWTGPLCRSAPSSRRRQRSAGAIGRLVERRTTGGR